MQVTRLAEHLCLVDLQTREIRNFIASYILKGKQAAIVESGPTSSVPNLLLSVKQLNIRLEDVAYVAVSHVHLDHGGGVGTLIKHLPNARVIVHPRGVQHLANPQKLWQQSQAVLGKIAEFYSQPEPVPQERIIAAADEMMFDIGNDVKLKVIETLGHASHHMSYYEPLTQGIFPGDAAGIYIGEIGVNAPTTPSPFRLDVALASLGKLMTLNPKVLYYSHFGKAENAVDRLKSYMHQLMLWAKIARQGLDDNEDFSTIRKRVIENDAYVQKALTYITVHPILSETVLNESVRGIIDFVANSPLPQ